MPLDQTPHRPPKNGRPTTARDLGRDGHGQEAQRRWTTLYVLMAFAVWRTLRLPEASAARRLALTLFFAQLAINAAWSWMFFGAHNPLLGAINIVPQILVILATIVAFYRLDRMAGWCLVPLAAWVSFATVLNFAIWTLNP
jgi:tryptophan-rich sensory protein